MSRTYRNSNWWMEICNNCNLPLNTYAKHTVEHGDKRCTCWDGDVVRKVGYIDNRKVFKSYSYYSYEDFWGIATLPTREVQGNYKVWDSESPHGTKKPYQQARNRSFRAKTKQVLRDRNTRWEDKIYPINKKTVEWDIW